MDQSKYLQLYLSEMHENVTLLGNILVLLEKSPKDTALITEALRLFHSGKGLSATMGYEEITKICHHFEGTLDSIRTEKRAILSKEIDSGLKALDHIEEFLAKIAGEEPDIEDTQKEQITSVRIESKELDTLMDVSGELSTLRMQYQAFSESHTVQNPLLRDLNARLIRLTDELQFQTLQMRLIPLNQVFLRFPRLVRELAGSEGKEVSFSMRGTDIEVDKMIVDAIIAPLIHLLRNAIDHGIETPEDRVQAGKTRTANVTVSVEQQEGYVSIQVTDDGRAIDLEDVKRHARQCGFSEDEITHITQENVLSILQHPHFTTVDEVNAVSGRGVGLTAVHRTAKELGGTFLLTQTESSKTFHLLLPLRVSIIQALLMHEKDQMYALPFVYVDRLFDVKDADIHTTLGGKSIAVDGESIPMIHLQSILSDSEEQQYEPTENAIHHIILIRHGGDHIALEVDSISHNAEVMVKPIAQVLRSLSFFAGSTILGDGSVAMVLDVPSLFAACTVTK